MLCVLALCLSSCVEAIALCIGFVPPLVWRIRFVSFVESLMERVEVLLGESGDVELGARISKHIIVFVFGYLSQLYSLYISHCYYCLSIHA